jgi:hypothetical protein
MLAAGCRPWGCTTTDPSSTRQIQTVDPDSLENLPIGLDGRQYQWVDLDSEGISGILTEQGTGWFYKRNLGGAQFGPSGTGGHQALGGGAAESPAAGDGSGGGWHPGHCAVGTPLTGYYQREADGEWRNFQSFESIAQRGLG